MGCSTSHDVFASVVSKARRRCRPSSSSTRGGAGDPAAACRERVELIRAAADRRFALAAAHAAYFRSLAAVGGALRRFAEAALLPATTPVLGSSSPVLTLPRSPTKPVAPSSSAAAAPTSTLPPSPSSSSSTVSPLSHSLSYGDDDLEALAHARHARARAGGRAPPPPEGTSSTRHYYMRKSTTVPTVVYENPYGEYTEGETSYGYRYPDGPYGEVVVEPEMAPRARAPSPLPPPAPDASPWDFFDPFTSYDQFMDDYSGNTGVDGNFPTNSPNYSEVRRMEGIPELEDEAELEAEAEASKPSTSGVADQNVKGKRPVPTNADSKGEPSDGRLPRKGSGGNGESEKPVSRNNSVPINASSKSKKGSKSNTSSLKGTSSTASLKGNDGGHIDGRSSPSKKKGLAFDEDSSVVAEEGNEGSHMKSMQSAVSSESFSPLHDGNRDVIKAMEEVEERFGEAMDGGAEISKLLEVGKLPQRTAPRVLRYLSSKVVDPISLTVPSSSSCVPKRHRNSRSSSSRVSVTSRRNDHGDLSSTLEKLCIWEKKLYQEVKDEEKLRILYEKKYRQLKSLDERGAEPNVIDSARLSLRDLRSRISVNIRTASAFSAKIEKIRDEELYPQLVDLIQGLRRMWKVVLDCHQKQLFAIQDSKIHLLKAITISQSRAAAVATVELERELVKWYRCFNKWIGSQRSYVEALNGWLKKWFPEVQEQDTTDGIPPFSPGKLGAAPIFIISNDWFQAIEMVPKNEMLRAIDHFSKLVHELKKAQQEEHRQKIKADHASRDYDKRREVLQRELESNTSLDMVAVMANNHSSHDSRVIELQKTRKRRDDERARHSEVVKHVHLAASATLPVGFVPMLEQIISFFQGNLQVYMGIRIHGTYR